MRSLFLLLLRFVFAIGATAAVGVALLAIVPPLTSAFMIGDAIARRSLPAYDWRPASKISGHMLVAVVAAEDQRFDVHSGFDFAAIEKAARSNSRGGKLRGASTISQQVAKNLFLWPGRSWLRKGLEAALTLMIETMWSKHRILEIYVNIAEMGEGVFGAEAASQKFFGKPAAALTARDAALLAAVLPDPHDLHAGAPSSYVRRRQQWILRQMSALGGEKWLERL